MDFSFLDGLYSDETEFGAIANNDKANFYNEMKNQGFDFSDVDEETRLPKSLLKTLSGDIDYVLKFNNVLLTMHRTKKSSIIESIVNLTTDYVDFSELMKILQPNVLGMLTSELATKHKLMTISSTSAVSKFIH